MVDQTSCAFCRIIDGSAPASLVYTDATAIAFLDIAPLTTGHVLVVPRQHVMGLGDVDPEVGAHVFRVAQRVAAGLRGSGLRCDGVNLFLADGAAAFQEVFHFHLHVIPRWRGDGFALRARRGAPGRADLQAAAKAIRAAVPDGPTS